MTHGERNVEYPTQYGYRQYTFHSLPSLTIFIEVWEQTDAATRYSMRYK
ncbi:MAG: hypothetical protein GY768_13930 [Planctomycetaceae bacterium]|nr:hypothetical protein [Planctomycetaceae bacterium]